MTPLPVAPVGPPLLVVVSGSRDWTDRKAIHGDLASVEATGRLWAVVEGDARGADRIAGRGWASKARRRGVGWVSVPADWAKHGRKAAGPIRNRLMLDYACQARELGVTPILFAYPLPASVGTLDMNGSEQGGRRAGDPPGLTRSGPRPDEETGAGARPGGPAIRRRRTFRMGR